MRFFSLASVALSLASAVSAAPLQRFLNPDSLSPSVQVKQLSLSESTGTATLISIQVQVNAPVSQDSDDEDDGYETFKYKPSAIKLDFPKVLQKGSIAQNQREAATDLAKRAMYQANVSAGKVIYGWHDENTEDPIEHFTVEPSAGTGASKGKIHVHRDGSWTQGKGGKANKGDGKV